jgi:hypothetical protein
LINFFKGEYSRDVEDYKEGKSREKQEVETEEKEKRVWRRG